MDHLGQGVRAHQLAGLTVLYGPLEGAGLQPRDHVELRPGGAGDRDPVVAAHLPAVQIAAAVGADAPGPAVPGDRHLERRVPPSPEAPQGHGGAVAQHGPGAAGQDRRHGFLVWRHGRATDGVDAGMDPVEAAVLDQ
ncbi:MAG TPA: hypothetical protein VMU90_11100 [Solirubrobacteraceae bacterium]|nr:hypothetical protein [Solirubrobacteraceae bacterium]